MPSARQDAPVLIANRGEVVMRVQRTLRARGRAAVIVFSDDDESLRYVRDVKPPDVACRLPGAEAVETYLDAAALMEIAERTGATSLHPGYGFLSENAAFAEGCADRGISFIGPTPRAMRAMSTKLGARQLATRESIPVVPGRTFSPDSQADIESAAAEVGFPLAVKASSGGGGIGMTVLDDPARLQSAVGEVAQLGARFFGDPTVYIERYLPRCRHIEVQLACDQAGNIETFTPRDCSMQRRFQKVIEETPSPKLPESAALLARSYAETIARAVGYDSIGTVEFLYDLDSGDIYFLEMNTRLQVEHGITEMVHDVDLVGCQIDASAGLPVTRTWHAEPHGHAIEVRLYAEDSQTGFPNPGTISHLVMPESTGVTRVDCAHMAGSLVSINYDPLIAKIQAWGESRRAALEALSRSLETIEVEGVKTNLALVQHALNSAEFVSADYDARSLEQLRTTLSL